MKTINDLSDIGIMKAVKKLPQLAMIFAVLSAGTLFAQTAAAQDCANIGENAEFTELFQKMNAQVKAESYKDALKTAQRLIEICPTVPSVNYVAGKIYQKMGDTTMAHSYYRVATENTKQYAVDQDLMNV